MERRTAVAIALSVAATAMGAGAAVAANVGLLSEEPDPVGQLEVSNVGDLVGSSTTVPATPTTPQTIIIDVPVPTPGLGTTAGAEATGGATAGSSPDVPTTPTTVDDHGGDRPAGVSDDDDDLDDEHEDEEHEHEDEDEDEDDDD